MNINNSSFNPIDWANVFTSDNINAMFTDNTFGIGEPVTPLEAVMNACGNAGLDRTEKRAAYEVLIFLLGVEGVRADRDAENLLRLAIRELSNALPLDDDDLIGMSLQLLKAMSRHECMNWSTILDRMSYEQENEAREYIENNWHKWNGAFL